MEKYLEKIAPQVSDRCEGADELYLKIKGDGKYLYVMMDDDTILDCYKSIKKKGKFQMQERLLQMSRN